MIKINKETCIGCGQCVNDCITNDIEIKGGKAESKEVTCINCGHCVAICPVKAVSIDALDMEEVKEFDKDTFLIEEDRLLNFIKFRRSTRQFKNKEVEKVALEKIVEAGRYTQTGRNLQDVSYTVVTKGVQELRELVLENLNITGNHILANLNPQSMMYKPYAELWVKMYNDFIENPEGQDKLFFNAKAVIIISSQSEVNGALASSNMELMTNALGLGTFFSGFAVRAAVDNPKIASFLDLPKGHKVVTCMVIGHPKVTYKRSVPREKAQVNWK